MSSNELGSLSLTDVLPIVVNYTTSKRGLRFIRNRRRRLIFSMRPKVNREVRVIITHLVGYVDISSLFHWEFIGHDEDISPVFMISDVSDVFCVSK